MCFEHHTQLLTDKDAELVNLTNKKGVLPIFDAISKNKINATRILLENEAYISERNQGHTILHVAAQIFDKEMVELLLANGAEKLVNAQEMGEGENGVLPIHMVSVGGHMGIVEL